MEIECVTVHKVVHHDSHITFMLLFALFVRKIVHELNSELVTTRNTTIKSEMRLLSGFKDKTWYFVHFPQRPDLDDLRAQNIPVSSESIIGKTWLKLFLTSEQAGFLVERMSAELVEVSPGQKIFDSVKKSDAKSLQSSDDEREIRFAVECSHDFTLTVESGTVTKAGDGMFVVTFDALDSNIKEKLEEIAKLEQVSSIERLGPVKLFNRWAVPFVQDNSIAETPAIESERKINAQGLNGEGITILVSDSGVDVNNTFFYDPNVELETNKVLPNHRKVVYYGTSDDHFDHDSACHGTHVAGTAVGKAICTDCPETLYPGAAPEAKLGFVKHVATGLLPMPHLEIMEKVNAVICSCSWGISQGYDAVFGNIWNKAILQNPDKLFIFSSGNRAEIDIRGAFPGQAKNILTVGAIKSLSTTVIEHLLKITFTGVEGDFYEFVLPWFTPVKSGDVFTKQEGSQRATYQVTQTQIYD